MNINRFKSQLGTLTTKDRFEVELHGPIGIRSRGIRCTGVTIPAKTISTISNSYVKAGPTSNFADMVDYGGTVDLTFMLDQTFEDRQKIELWQSYIFDEAYNLQYPSEYYGSINIKQLGLDGLPIYDVELHQCFPTILGEVSLDSTSTDIQTLTVTFAFRSWSSSYENSPTGLLGGLFKKFSRKITSKLNKKISDKLFG